MKDTPNSADVHVGARIRLRRTALNKSQGTLAEQIGVSYQQLQKYENAINRVSAGRLYRIALALAVPVSFFFDGLATTGELTSSDALRILQMLGALRGCHQILELHTATLQQYGHDRGRLDAAVELADPSFWRIGKTVERVDELLTAITLAHAFVRTMDEI